MRRSAGLISMAACSSGSGSTATVQAEVWMRPWDSVSGTRCAVRAGLELELGVDVVTLDTGDHLFIAAVFALVLGEDLDSPALALGVARVHAEQVAGEDRRLVATGAGADLEEHVAAVVGVLGQQHALQAGLQLDQLLAGLGDLFLGHLAQVRVAVLSSAWAPSRSDCTLRNSRKARMTGSTSAYSLE